MISIYLDSQVYRSLKSGVSPIGNALCDYFNVNKSRFLFYYSYAHLLDLKEDKTEHKFDDLDYMQNWVDDNLLIQHFQQQHATYTLKTPIQAFNEYIKEDEFKFDTSTLFDINQFSDFATKEQLNELDKQITLLKESVFPDIYDGLNVNPETKKILDQLLPIQGGSSFFDLISNMMTFNENFQQDNNLYKDLRKFIGSNIQEASKQKQIVSDNEHFIVDIAEINSSNEKKQKYIHNQLLSFVKSNLKSIKIDDPTQHDIHYQSYLSLDLLGIEQEKAGKIKTRSLLNDAHHSFYGGFCDVVISQDLQFREKSKILYRLFNLKTQVFSMQEFLSQKILVQFQFEANSSSLFDKLTYDIKHAIVNTAYKDTLGNDILCYNSQLYLNYFNEVHVCYSERKTILTLRRINVTYMTRLPYKILKSVINLSADLFGVDYEGQSEFSDLDEEKIEAKTWQGRNWYFNKKQMHLVLDTTFKQLEFILMFDL